MKTIFLLWVAACFSGLFFNVSTSFAQGSLTPPGAPSPGMKTLDQVQPRIPVDSVHTPGQNNNEAFTISSPGSYYLTTNLSSTKSIVIHITAPNVALDLNGFSITGNGSNNGVQLDTSANSCAVRNGSLSNFVDGIADSGTYGSAYRDLSISGCTFTGLLSGQGSLVESCLVHHCSGFIAIHVYNGSTVSHCTVVSNTASYGIAAEVGSVVSECSARANVITNPPTSVESAIWSGSGGTILKCSLNGNSALAGIWANPGCTVESCTVYGQTGFNTNCTGISVYGSSTVTGCTVTYSGTNCHGFYIGDGSTITHCTANFDKGDGFQFGNGCHITDCNARANAANGFHGTGTANRIEGNLATVNFLNGFLSFTPTGDYIVRNISYGNGTNYYPASGANFGTLSTPGTAGASPWANF